VLSDRLSFIVVRPQRHPNAFSRPAAQIKQQHRSALQNVALASPGMHVSVGIGQPDQWLSVVGVALALIALPVVCAILSFSSLASPSPYAGGCGKSE
jgi:hypothetical protein